MRARIGARKALARGPTLRPVLGKPVRADAGVPRGEGRGREAQASRGEEQRWRRNPLSGQRWATGAGRWGVGVGGGESERPSE